DEAGRVRDADSSGGTALERRGHPRHPLGSDTAGRACITITAGKGDPAPIPPELLGAWWRAAERAPSQVAADYYRFQLLTGCRGVEIHGHKLHKYPPTQTAFSYRNQCSDCALGLLSSDSCLISTCRR